MGKEVGSLILIREHFLEIQQNSAFDANCQLHDTCIHGKVNCLLLFKWRRLLLKDILGKR